MVLNELHSIGVSGEFRAQIEAVHPLFIKQGILRAQKKTWSVLHELRGALTEGLKLRLES